MKILAIDTTSSDLILALTIDGSAHTAVRHVGKSGHSSVLMPEIDALLSRCGVNVSELDAVAAVVGPGSFTGIRIGVSAVTALSFATGAKRISVTSFDLIAYDRESVLAAVDAGHGNVYLASVKGGKTCETSFVTADEATSLYGVEFEPLSDRARTLADVVMAKAERGEFVDVLEPFYMRKSQAEREKDED